MLNFDPIDFGDGPKAKVAKALGITDEQWKAYKNWIGAKESSDRYDIMGGANNHYAGRYQMGDAAIKDAARLLGRPVPSKEAFLKNPKMQDEFFEAYTLANIGYMKGNKDFEARKPQEKLGIIGYAHNQGHGGAKEYMRTGQTGFDAFGTAGSDYLAAAGQAPGGPIQAGDPRGITEEDIAGQPALGAMGPGAQQPTPPQPATPPTGTIDLSTPMDFGQPSLEVEVEQPGVPAAVASMDEATDSDLDTAISNIPSSAKKYVTDIASALYNYDDTAEGLSQLAKGVGSYMGLTEDNPEAERVAKAVKDFYVDRYGGIENIRKTFREDPVGFAGDLSGVLFLGGGTALTGAKTAAKAGTVAARAAAPVEKLGRSALGLSNTIEPLNVVGRPAIAAAKGASGLVANYGLRPAGAVVSGTNPDSIKTAYDIGKRSGAERARMSPVDLDAARQQKVFRGGITGKSDTLLPVAVAEQGFSKFKQRGQIDRKIGLMDAESKRTGTVRPLQIDQIANDVDAAFKTKGKVKSLDEFSTKQRKKIEGVRDEIYQQTELLRQDPSLNGVWGLDNIKRKVHSMRDNFKKGSKGQAYVDKIAAEIKQEIIKVAPEYADVMKRADESMKIVRQIEDELKLGAKNPNIGAKIRQLQAALRAGAHQGWQTKMDVVDFLTENGAPDLKAALSGQEFNPYVAKGLARYVMSNFAFFNTNIGANTAGAAGAGAAATVGLLLGGVKGAAIAAVMTSPRVWGNVANRMGQGVGFVQAANELGIRPAQVGAKVAAQQAGRLNEEGIFPGGMQGDFSTPMKF